MNSDSLKKHVQQTLEHYQDNSESFWDGTKDHDVSQNYAAFQTRLPAWKDMNILDLGCGPGRDLLHFKNRGHNPVGVDGCENFCNMARENSKCEVWHQEFCRLELPENQFHGVFANASLFHVPRVHLLRVLKELAVCLKSEGILFSSNPRGNGENFDGRRYGNYMELEVYSELLVSAGFEVIDHYYRPTGWPREEQPWLAVVSRKL